MSYERKTVRTKRVDVKTVADILQAMEQFGIPKCDAKKIKIEGRYSGATITISNIMESDKDYRKRLSALTTKRKNEYKKLIGKAFADGKIVKRDDTYADYSVRNKSIVDLVTDLKEFDSVLEGLRNA